MLKDSKSFFHSVSVLFTGVVFSQVLSYLLSPIITRQFDPESSAYLGLFLRITTLGAALATARLEMALPLEKEKHHAFGIYRFSFRFSIIISCASLLILVVFSGVWANTIFDVLFLLSLPIGILLTAFYNLGASWSLRNSDYKTISRSSILLSVGSNFLKVGFGLISGNFIFLILATLFGFFISSFVFVKDFIREKKTAILNRKSKRTISLVLKNSDLYTYNLPHVFIDLSRDLLLASIIWNCYGKSEFGSFDHAFKMLKLPIVFIGAAIGQVFFKKCTELIQNNKSIRPITLTISLFLFLVSVIPFSIMFFYGSTIFNFVFGPKWAFSGRIATVISPWLMLNFITSPISYIPILVGAQKMFFWLNLVGTILMIIVVSIPYLFEINITFIHLLSILNVVQSIFLGLILIWIFKIARN